jgi:hypothetical protein
MLLLDYLQNVLKRVREYQALTSGEQPEIFRLNDNINVVLNNEFVQSSTEYGVERWEKLLEIMPPAGQSLDDRKAVILLRLLERLPFTYRQLISFLNSNIGENLYTVDLYPDDYRLTVILAIAVEALYDPVMAMLRRVVPANIILDLQINYNKHNYVGEFLHEELHPYTHWQIKRWKLEHMRMNPHNYVSGFKQVELTNYTHFQIRHDELVAYTPSKYEELEPYRYAGLENYSYKNIEMGNL